MILTIHTSNIYMVAKSTRLPWLVGMIGSTPWQAGRKEKIAHSFAGEGAKSKTRRRRPSAGRFDTNPEIVQANF